MITSLRCNYRFCQSAPTTLFHYLRSSWIKVADYLVKDYFPTLVAAAMVSCMLVPNTSRGRCKESGFETIVLVQSGGGGAVIQRLQPKGDRRHSEGQAACHQGDCGALGGNGVIRAERKRLQPQGLTGIQALPPTFIRACGNVCK